MSDQSSVINNYSSTISHAASLSVQSSVVASTIDSGVVTSSVSVSSGTATSTAQSSSVVSTAVSVGSQVQESDVKKVASSSVTGQSQVSHQFTSQRSQGATSSQVVSQSQALSSSTLNSTEFSQAPKSLMLGAEPVNNPIGHSSTQRPGVIEQQLGGSTIGQMSSRMTSEPVANQSINHAGQSQYDNNVLPQTGVQRVNALAALGALALSMSSMLLFEMKRRHLN